MLQLSRDRVRVYDFNFSIDNNARYSVLRYLFISETVV